MKDKNKQTVDTIFVTFNGIIQYMQNICDTESLS